MTQRVHSGTMCTWAICLSAYCIIGLGENGRIMRQQVRKMVKSQPVLSVAVVAMLITCILVPVDTKYLDYFNLQTLATLFCTLAVVSAFGHIHVFEILSKSIILKLADLRSAVMALVFITFFGSMVLANDMALLTFLPLGYFVLHKTENEQAMAFTFIMQNIAANLGGMLTPFGNPQNLYLYAHYQIGTVEFMQIMFPCFFMATLLILAICLLVKPVPLTLKRDEGYVLDKQKTFLYSLLFVFSILIVFRVVPYALGTAVVVLALLFLDKAALKEVNYPLLLTFCVFFVFSGNAARIPAVNELFSALLPKNTLLFGILSCQCISNVPSAVLLSHFTMDYASLLPAVNIGGLGTPIASLASLITLTEFKKRQPEKMRSYFLLFSGLNILFLVVLYLTQKNI